MKESQNRRYYKVDNRKLFWARKWEEQEGKCAICDAATRLVIDHDHETGTMRGLLCYKHNTALGMFKDSAELLRNAIEYLEKTTKTPVILSETPTAIQEKRLMADEIIPALLANSAFTSDRARARVLVDELGINYNTAVTKVRRAREKMSE